MWEDPIVKETRRLREEYASAFNGDTRAILNDILKQQAKHEDRLVSFPARKLDSRKGAA